MGTESAGRKSVYGAFVANFLIAIAKFAAAFISGSSAMLSEGIHSVVDSTNELLLLLGINRSKLPPDETHPFGHGSEIYFWGLIVAVIIFGVGGGFSVYEGIIKISRPSEIGDFSLNYVVLGIAFVMETISLYIAYRNLRKTSTGESFFSSFRNSKNPAIFTVIAEDTAALTGVIIAFAGIALSSYFQNPIFDGSASILIGSVLIVAAISLAYETRGLLVGESADKEILEGIREIAKREMLVTAIDKPLTMYLGPDEVLVTMRVTFKKELSGPEIVKATNELKQKIMEKFPVIKIIYIETE